jgi:hypothetical protein
MKFYTVITPCLIGMLLVIALLLPVNADIPVNATPETSRFFTSTAIDNVGTVTQSNSLTWQLSSTSLHDPPLDAGGIADYVWYDANWNPVEGWTADPLIAELLSEPIPHGEVRYTSTYSADLNAVEGSTTLVKQVGLDTGNIVGNNNNIDVNTVLTFVTSEGPGRATSEEVLLIYGAGAQTTTAGTSLCPYAAGDSPFAPPFCSLVQMGSKIDVLSASVTTSADGRFVSATTDIPVAMDYSINGKGVSAGGVTPYAEGLMSAFMGARLQDGRMQNITPYNPEVVDQPAGFIPVKSADISYSESTSATGLIGQFAKDMHYQSGKRLL